MREPKEPQEPKESKEPKDPERLLRPLEIGFRLEIGSPLHPLRLLRLLRLLRRWETCGRRAAADACAWPGRPGRDWSRRAQREAADYSQSGTQRPPWTARP